MKKLIKDTLDIPVIEIIAVLSDDIVLSMPIAAAKHDVHLEYRELPPEWQLTDAEFSVYHSFVISMASIVASYGFEIVEEYQSDESYSYYIKFTPSLLPGALDNADTPIPMKPGTDLLLDVKLRLSNHYLPQGSISTDNVARSSSTGYTFKEYVVAGVTHDNINSAIVDLQGICQALQLGDYSRLLG